jgi:cobalt-zinc-cadmium efflux system outer membrane protein
MQFLDSVRQLTLSVQSTFVDVQLAHESLALAQENLRALNAIVDVNRVRVSAGDLAKLELVRSQVAALQFENSVRQAGLRLRTAQNRLQLLLGRSGSSESLEVVGQMRRDPVTATLTDLQARAVQFRPDLQALVRDQARSLNEIRLQLAQAKVDYTVGTMYHHQYGYSNGRSLGFFLSAPLPVFNRNQGEIERARVEQRQIETRIRALRASIASEVESGFQQYSTARSLLENIEANMLDRAKEVRQTTEYSYRRGEASLVEFLDAQRASNDTIDSYNQARAEYARSLYLLESVTAKELAP